MDFDHLTKIKNGNVSRLPLRVAIEEVKICELVCSNCHRIRTQARRWEAHHAVAEDADIELYVAEDCEKKLN